LDLLKGPATGKYDAVYSLGVVEHIPTDKEYISLKNTFASLKDNGITIVGMPSLES